MSDLTHEGKRIHVATDHAGFELKEQVTAWLKSEGREVTDHGATQMDELDDFPDYIGKAAAAVSKNSTESVAIIFGGSGQGEAMVANRYKNVRATVYYGGSMDIVTLSREHNDANTLSIGARFVDLKAVKEVIMLWLETSFDGSDKRIRRNKKIEHQG